MLNLNWHRAYSEIEAEVSFKAIPDDFIVEEELSFTPSGEGEHLFLSIRKTGLTSDYVADRLARWAGIPRKDVSMAGYKDKQAVTTQWFSLGMGGVKLPENKFDLSGCVVLEETRNLRKLKRGAIARNKFKIRLRNAALAGEVIEQRIALIQQQGTPNYFGHQRFGRDGSNVVNAKALLKKKRGRESRSMIISAMRSYLFNSMLSQKVKNEEWRVSSIGDPIQLSGSKSWFTCEGVDEERQRILSGDCSPTLPLFSQKMISDEVNVQQLSDKDMDGDINQLIELLSKQRLEPAVRATILRPSELTMVWQDDDLILSFSLPTGSYATTLLRELATVIN